MLTKQTTFLDSTVEGENLVYRQRVSILEDGREIMSTVENVVVLPNDAAALTIAPAIVQATARLTWDTEAALKDYEDSLDKRILARIKAKELQLEGLDDVGTRPD
jgi:hypothetical protein